MSHGRTEHNAHIELTASASCFRRKDMYICEPIRVWADHGATNGATLREVSPLGQPGFVENVSARANRTLRSEVVHGSWYLLESFSYVDNFAHCLFQLLPKLAVYLRLPSSTGLLVPRHRLTTIVVEFLWLFNVSYTILEPDSHYVVQNLTVSSYATSFGMYTDAVTILRAPTRRLAPSPAMQQHAQHRHHSIFLRRERSGNASLNNGGVRAHHESGPRERVRDSPCASVACPLVTYSAHNTISHATARRAIAARLRRGSLDRERGGACSRARVEWLPWGVRGGAELIRAGRTPRADRGASDTERRERVQPALRARAASLHACG